MAIMPAIPAYCETCDTWTPSGIALGGSGNQFYGMITQCERCGGKSRMIDGAYEVVNESIKLIRSHDLTRKEIKQLNKILQRAMDQNTPTGQIREIIKRELPAASDLVTYITSGGNLRTDILILIAVFTFFLQFQGSFSKALLNEERTVNKVIEELTRSKPELTQKIGVNDPCWCKSGKKLKKCHGSKLSRGNPNDAKRTQK